MQLRMRHCKLQAQLNVALTGDVNIRFSYVKRMPQISSRLSVRPTDDAPMTAISVSH